MHVLFPGMICVVNQRITESDPDEFQQAVDAGYVEIYMLTPFGVIKHHKLRDGKDGADRFIRVPVKEIPGMKLLPLKNEITFLPAGRVPYRLFQEIVQFFKNVMSTHKQELEAMAMVLWSQERGYFIHVPKQNISKASVRYDWDSLPAGASVIVDIH
jgi:hypothetical protein